MLLMFCNVEFISMVDVWLDWIKGKESLNWRSVCLPKKGKTNGN